MGCTGSCDDPEVLAFLDNPRSDHSHLACRALIEQVKPDLILDGSISTKHPAGVNDWAHGFLYALGVGRVFCSPITDISPYLVLFLCPWCRAGASAAPGI
jgi:hypothetical protein